MAFHVSRNLEPQACCTGRTDYIRGKCYHYGDWDIIRELQLLDGTL